MKGDICRIDGCSAVVHAKGLVCNICWRLKIRYGSFTHVVTPKIRAVVCRIEGCDRPLAPPPRGLVCGSCLKKKKRYGSFTHKHKPHPTLQERLWSRVENTGSCWLWNGTKSRGGYGRMNVDRKTISVHRVSWNLHNGIIPDGMFVLHKCDVRNCVNPEHLFLGNNQDNMTDMVNKGRHVAQHMKGELHPLVKLREHEVKEIKKLLSIGGSCKIIAAKYNISPQAISGIKNNRTWRHVSWETI